MALGTCANGLDVLTMFAGAGLGSNPCHQSNWYHRALGRQGLVHAKHHPQAPVHHVPGHCLWLPLQSGLLQGLQDVLQENHSRKHQIQLPSHQQV
ncbi:rCG49933 [Rattus norvegicus]|uniref:RCG49933 n=1 Tax=Rattus norvegicus TaxID=10116 RepID=A6K508_RAT|nr:rCG49933 [Rattus norvegicus]